jgi:class 3 adenylate cyclase/tetratricopeptide (TPR) repeat protein
MRCPSCEWDGPDEARFCASCGTRLAGRCAACQADLPPAARFCASCGTPVADSAAAAPAEHEPQRGRESAATSERRRVSVLFVDLANFTSLAEAMDPEEVRAVQSRYFEVARSVVATYGGTIEKFIGDAVMAVWGTPSAHEDDPERAVRAALAVVYAVDRIGGAASGRDLRARAAVTTGEAAVTIGAIGQGMVAGDLVNVAARLQGRAPLGGVLVDRPTRDHVPGASFQRIGSMSLKGRSARIEVFRATDVTVDPGGGTSTAHTGPLIGREQEFRELTDLLGRVMHDRRSRLVSLTGIAGIGKSRLAWELGRWVDAQPDEIAWHEGRAVAYGEGVAFAALAQMVRRRARIADGAPPELALRQLASSIEEFVRDEAERRWIEPRLAVLLTRDQVGSFDRDELFAAWRRFFERVAERTPAVFVFEDLQWADPAMIDFIEYLATWSKSLPILVVALARPDFLDDHPTWGTGVGSLTALTLQRLPDDAMRQLLDQRAPGLSPALIGQIIERAGGVPLYAVEVARMLHDRRTGTPAERRRTSRVAVEQGGTGELVPDSLQGVLAERIDGLAPGERRLLLAAAVLGHRFRPDALVSVTGGDPARVRERIDGLVRREFLVLDGELTSPGRGELGFVQDLVREVAYQRLPRSERRTLHLAAAQYLESLDDDVAEQLAGHLVEVHRLTTQPREALRIARRAVAALRHAADGAFALHVPGRALGLLEAALRLAEERQRPMILAEAGDAARAAGRPETAEAHLRELITLQLAAGDRSAAARTRARLASVLLSSQRNEPALRELEAAMRAIRGWSDDPSGVELAAQLARVHLVMGDDRTGLDWSARALAAAERMELSAVAIDLRVTRGTARFGLGEHEAGLADLRSAIEQAQEVGVLRVELRARNNEAWALLGDDPRAAMETARQGLELATTMGLGDLAVPLADLACTAAIETGDWAWALETIRELEERGLPEFFRVVLRASVATIETLRGSPRAMVTLDELEPLPPETDGQVLAGVRHARAWSALLAGDLASAQRLADEATEGYVGADPAYQRALAIRARLWNGDTRSASVGLADLASSAPWGRATEATVATLRAGVDALRGRTGAARAYRRARESWESLGLPLQLAMCMLDEQRLLPAEAPSGELAQVLTDLGADGLLRLIERPRARGPAARSRRPSGRTGSRSGGARRSPPATDPGPPPD